MVSDGSPLSACAGVSVVKAKYPFYRAYRLAEELCSNAKRSARKHGGSWIDFHLASGGRSGSLGELRDWHYTVAQGSLLKRPYALTQTCKKEYLFSKMIKATADLFGAGIEGTGLPNSKLHEFREVLAQEEAAGSRFVLEQRNRGRLQDTAYDKLFEAVDGVACTRFFDMIEMTELYPLFRFAEEIGHD